ncbi:hypothetical protein WCLP8_4690012 [uncultured Gammaproteobacteria bacterium]
MYPSAPDRQGKNSIGTFEAALTGAVKPFQKKLARLEKLLLEPRNRVILFQGELRMRRST